MEDCNCGIGKLIDKLVNKYIEEEALRKKESLDMTDIIMLNNKKNDKNKHLGCLGIKVKKKSKNKNKESVIYNENEDEIF